MSNNAEPMKWGAALKTKILVLFLILTLLLSACSYQVVEDTESRKIYGSVFSAMAESDFSEAYAAQPEPKRTMLSDIAAFLKTIFGNKEEFAKKAEDQTAVRRSDSAEGTPSSEFVPMTIGARGSEVKAVQNRLREWGFMIGAADGIFGAVTESGVIELQRYLHDLGEFPCGNSLTGREKRMGAWKRSLQITQPTEEEYIPDGVISEELQAILLGEGQFALYREELSRGSRGAEVRRLQTRLYTLEYLSGGIDGQFGVNTANALKYFQKRNGLNQTGVADLDTQMLLFSDLAIKSDKPEYPYFIEVSVDKQRVYAYEWENGSYSKLVRTMKCSTGLPETPTPKGTYSMAGQAGKWYYFSKYDCWAQYAYRIYGPYLFHSVIYSEKDTSTLRQSSVSNLGSAASHGCIRLSVEDAKWLYENCAAGTKVKIY